MLRGAQGTAQLTRSIVRSLPLLTQSSAVSKGECKGTTRISLKPEDPAELGNLLGKLSLQSHQCNPHEQNKTYILPTTLENILYRKSIVDPLQPKKYELPTLTSAVNEKLTPTLESWVPKIDPDPLQKVIDQGTPSIAKIVMPYLVTIRHKKMKRHQLKKFRKRMRPLLRKRKEAIRKRKEREIQAIERQFHDIGQAFSPEQFIEERIEKAKRGGWKIDMLQTRMNNKQT